MAKPASSATEQLLRAAIAPADARPVGDEFRLQDLFSPTEWTGYSNGARTSAGKKFYAWSHTAPQVHSLRRDGQTALYRRV